MVRYIIKRVIMALITLFIITFLLFLLVRIMPGNPFPSERMSDEAIEKKREEMGLNDPIMVQYKNYIYVPHCQYSRSKYLQVIKMS